MSHRKPIYLGIIILLIFSLIFTGMIFYAQKPELKVIFLDVGQGDAILIEQGSNQILIDGGPSEQILLEKLGIYIPFWDREIETVIATHPDQDHIQGLIGVLKNYHVKNLIETTAKSESQLDKKFEELLSEKDIAKIKGERGLSIKLGAAILAVIDPGSDVPDGVVKETNNYSVVTKLSFGKNTFLFTGDLPEKEENELIESGTDLKSLVLKVAHHGSKYATSEIFLNVVLPKKAILSVGKNNRFGHPAPELMERLEKNQAEILRTDEQGDIEFVCISPQNDCIMETSR